MDLSKIWGLAKPIVIIVLCVIGYLVAANKIDGYLFTAIGDVSILFRGSAIWAGLVAIKDAISGK